MTNTTNASICMHLAKCKLTHKAQSNHIYTNGRTVKGCVCTNCYSVMVLLLPLVDVPHLSPFSRELAHSKVLGLPIFVFMDRKGVC